MSTSCSCLKLSAIAVSFANLSVGLCIFVYGCFLLDEYLHGLVTIGYLIVAFQLAFFLIFAGVTLLLGVIQAREKYVSLYLLISSLIWFVITNLTVFYMSFGRPLTGDLEQKNVGSTVIPTTTEMPTRPTVIYGEIPGRYLPLRKTIGFSLGLVLIWCGQLGVYKFHRQLIENNTINAGESYVRSAIHDEEKLFKNL